MSPQVGQASTACPTCEALAIERNGSAHFPRQAEIAGRHQEFLRSRLGARQCASFRDVTMSERTWCPASSHRKQYPLRLATPHQSWQHLSVRAIDIEQFLRRPRIIAAIDLRHQAGRNRRQPLRATPQIET